MPRAKIKLPSPIFQIISIGLASLLLATLFLLALYFRLAWNYLIANLATTNRLQIIQEITDLKPSLEFNLFFALDPSIINPKANQPTVYQVLSSDLDKLTEIPTEIGLVSNYQPVSPSNINTFGDGFSSLAHLNREQTNMYWDSQIGAFLFKPVASLSKLKNCGPEPCDYALPNSQFQQYCRQTDCLRLAGKQLFFNNRLLAWPNDLAAKNVLSIHLGLIGDNWIIGFILGEETEEAIWLYWFNGQQFLPLVTDQTEFVINLQAGSYPGTLSFTGQFDDFLIVYGAYYSKIIHVYQQKFYDVSAFLPLTLTTRSFLPLAQQSLRAQSFYVCNYSPNSPRLLKLWRGDKGQIIGSVDLSRLLFTDLGVNRLLCLPAVDSEDLILFLQIGSTWEQWRLFDQGFEQNLGRQVTSKNINPSSREVLAAFAASLSINSDKTAEQAYQLSFSNNGQDFVSSSPQVWTPFSTSGRALYWRIEFLTDGNPYYSPWLADFSILNYELSPLED